MSQQGAEEANHAERKTCESKTHGVRLHDDLTPVERERLYAAVGLMLDYILDNAPPPPEPDGHDTETGDVLQEPEDGEAVTPTSSNHQTNESIRQAESDPARQAPSVASVRSNGGSHDPEGEPVQLSLGI